MLTLAGKTKHIRLCGLQDWWSKYYRLGPQTLTPTHQRQVQAFAHQLSQLTKKSYATIYDDLKTAFSVPKYSDIPENQWEQVDHWFRAQIERATKRPK